MARIGVTYHDVAKAAEAIKTQNNEPTVDRVREHLGTGSKSTIAPFLKRWRADGKGSIDTDGLPNDLVEVVKALYKRVQQMADHRIEQARQEFVSSSDKLQKELTEADENNAQLSSHKQQLEEQLEQSTKEKELLGKSLEDNRVSLAKAESQHDEHIIRINELKTTLEEYKQENRDIRDHFEHYQQRIGEDRQLERDQFRTTSQQLQEQIQELKAQLARAETKSYEMFKANAQQQSAIDDLKEVNMEINNEVRQKNEEIAKLNEDLKATLTQNLQHQEEKQKLSEQVSTLSLQKANTDKEVAVLSQALQTVKAELLDAKDKVALLVQENKVVLQEKAMIEGKFKQFQESL